MGLSLGFRRSGASAITEALAALGRREAREKRYAEIFGRALCRAPQPTKDKEVKLLEDRQRAVVELFLKSRRDPG